VSCPCGVEPSPRDFAINVQGVYDGALIYQCYSCNALRPRFNVPSILHDRAVEIIAQWEKSGQAG